MPQFSFEGLAPRVHPDAFVANGATVLDGAHIGARAVVAAIPAGMEVPDGYLVAGVPSQLERPVAGSPGEMWVQLNPPAYAELAQRHRRGVALVEQ